MRSLTVHWLNGGQPAGLTPGARGRPPKDLEAALLAINKALNENGVMRTINGKEENTAMWDDAAEFFYDDCPQLDRDPKKDRAKADRKFKDAIHGKSAKLWVKYKKAKSHGMSGTFLWLVHQR